MTRISGGTGNFPADRYDPLKVPRKDTEVSPRSMRVPGSDGTSFSFESVVYRPVVLPDITVKGQQHELGIVQKLFELEASEFPSAKVAVARELLDELLCDIKKELARPENKDLPAVEKIKLAYEVMGKHYELKGQANDPSFVGNLCRGVLDCDTSAFVILALSEEMGWNIALRHAPGHVFVRYEDPGTGAGTNFDMGNIFSAEYYEYEFDVPKEQQDLVMPPLRGEQIEALFYLNRANMKYEKGDTAGALADVAHASLLSPNDPALWALMGQVQYAQGEYSAAEISFRKALALNTTNASVAFNLSATYIMLGDHDRAIELLESTVQEQTTYYGKVKSLKSDADAAVITTRIANMKKMLNEEHTRRAWHKVRDLDLSGARRDFKAAARYED